MFSHHVDGIHGVSHCQCSPQSTSSVVPYHTSERLAVQNVQLVQFLLPWYYQGASCSLVLDYQGDHAVRLLRIL